MSLNLIKKWFIKKNLLSDKDNIGITKSTALDLDAYIQHRIDDTPAVLPYKVYRALLTQTGTDAPVATVLENTLGGTVVWSYVDVGQYLLTATGLLTANKTQIWLDGVNQFDGIGVTSIIYTFNAPNTIQFTTFDSAGNQFQWASFLSDNVISIEIRVYP